MNTWDSTINITRVLETPKLHCGIQVEFHTVKNARRSKAYVYTRSKSKKRKEKNVNNYGHSYFVFPSCLFVLFGIAPLVYLLTSRLRPIPHLEINLFSL